MPCDQVRRMSVEWAVAEVPVVQRAFERAGLVRVTAGGDVVQGFAADGSRVTWSKRSGQLSADETQVAAGLGDTVKRAYATVQVERAARKFGWQTHATAGAANKLTLRRR